MKNFRKLLTVLTILALAIAMTAIPAFAAVESLTVTTDTANSTVPVTKYLTVGRYSPIPNDSFTYTLTPAQVADNTTANGAPVYPGPAVTSNTAVLEFVNSDMTTLGSAESDAANITTNGDQEKYATQTGSISLAGAVFARPGVYRYVLTETAGTTTDMSYDSREYTVDVYVINDANSYSIMAIISTQTKNSDGSELTNAGKSLNNAFTSAFSGHSLMISKTVTGNMGDRTATFIFDVLIEENDALGMDGQQVALDVISHNSDGTTTIHEAGLLIGTPLHIGFPSDVSIEITGLPAGTQYTVTERDYSADGYTTSYITTENGVAGDTQESNSVTNTIVSGGNIEAFTNHKDMATPTGIFLDIAPYAVMIILAFAGAVLMMFRKRKTAVR